MKKVKTVKSGEAWEKFPENIAFHAGQNILTEVRKSGKTEQKKLISKILTAFLILFLERGQGTRLYSLFRFFNIFPHFSRS